MATIVDLRSDSVTRPTAGMLDAMFSATVGDDVFGEDPTVTALEEKVARLFGHEDALYCPSGTMTNQIAIRLSTEPQDEVICDKRAHIYNYEGGGIAYNSLVSTRLVDGDHGRLTKGDVLENINPDDIYFPRTRLVSLENTVNKGGGAMYELQSVQEIRSVCTENDLKLHLDGARLFNALAESGDDPLAWGKCFDTISICLSKGLGAPVGSLLISSKVNIKKAKRIRKSLGGGMRQAGYLAAAGIYALDHHVERLVEDHQRARQIGRILQDLPWVTNVLPVHTNIVIFSLESALNVNHVLDHLNQLGIKAVPFGRQDIRMVTHLQITDEHLDILDKRLGSFSPMATSQ
jgi:threonine aldolase